MPPRTKLVVAGLSLLVVAGTLACTRYAIHRLSGDRSRATATTHEPVQGLGAGPLRLDPAAAHTHRLLLDAPALARLSESARLRTPAFRRVLARADEAASAAVASGYQGFEWADALANLALAWQATGDARYGEAAVRYLRALLDDRFVVGDGKGGADVVTHDSGYGIRTFGAYTALGYDWLREAPGMDPALRNHALERLTQWLAWYGTQGYLRDRPIANYYWGYLTTLSFAGLAASGESAAADGWLKQARGALSESVLPTFRDDLGGGGWPEGWQY
ncbi:MAG TPA: alginate lyase family protein, partial [Polyangiaceae bacterium]